MSRQRGFIASRDCGDVAAGGGEGDERVPGEPVPCWTVGLKAARFWATNSVPRVALPGGKED